MTKDECISQAAQVFATALLELRGEFTDVA
jgi:hypothetical protein